MNNLTVVICTYNRPIFLESTLESLRVQTNSNFKTIIVDNNSTENIKGIVEKFKNNSIKYYKEEKVGLSFARNKGFKESDTEYIAYLDDDAKAEETWVENILKIIEEEKPDIFGGPIYPYYLDRKPAWFKDSYETRTHGDSARQLNENEFLSGSNIIIKRSLLEELNGFRTDLGMKGKELGYGEETDFQARYKNQNSKFKIKYYPSVKVFHYVNPKKMTLKYRFQNLYKSTQSSNKIGHKNNPFSKILKVLRMGFKLLPGLLIRDRNKYPYYENFVMEKVLNYKS